MNKQRAGAVGALALTYLWEGKLESADEHQPEYLRMAQAERTDGKRACRSGKWLQKRRGKAGMIRLMKEEDLGSVAQLEQTVFLCRGQNVICVKVFYDRNIFSCVRG